jgi:hypothetical protein
MHLGNSYLQFLDVCIGFLQEMVPISLSASVRTVKILALESIGPNLESIVGLLRCFPCIEKLYIKVIFVKC